MLCALCVCAGTYLPVEPGHRSARLLCDGEAGEVQRAVRRAEAPGLASAVGNVCDCFDLQPRGSNKQRLGFREVLKEMLASEKTFGRRRACQCREVEEEVERP